MEHVAAEKGFSTELLKSVDAVNDRQKNVLFNKLKKHFGDLKGKKIAVWGLAFKPRTDDIREAPSLVLIHSLLEVGAKVFVHDPVAMENVKKEAPSIALVDDMYECARGADALVISTDWDEFKSPDFGRLAESLKGKVIFDGRNLYQRGRMAELGFTYYSVGRAAVKA
jgi:UDPglucose 6-dehydrogenase